VETAFQAERECAVRIDGHSPKTARGIFPSRIGSGFAAKHPPGGRLECFISRVVSAFHPLRVRAAWALHARLPLRAGTSTALAGVFPVIFLGASVVRHALSQQRALCPLGNTHRRGGMKMDGAWATSACGAVGHAISIPWRNFIRTPKAYFIRASPFPSS
jgi:hypothetical protein